MKTVQNQAKPVSKQTWRNKVTYVKKNWQLYLFFLMPGLLLTIIFKYLPMGGLLIAFEDYNVIKGVLGSPWVGLEYCRRFLSSPDFMNYLMNTLKLSIYGLLWGFPVDVYKRQGLGCTVCRTCNYYDSNNHYLSDWTKISASGNWCRRVKRVK